MCNLHETVKQRIADYIFKDKILILFLKKFFTYEL